MGGGGGESGRGPALELVAATDPDGEMALLRSCCASLKRLSDTNEVISRIDASNRIEIPAKVETDRTHGCGITNTNTYIVRIQ